jgi:hypothetical protein
MKIVKIIGGLGNQMFQYAFYLALKQFCTDIKVDLSAFQSYELHNNFELNRIFNIKFDTASKKNRLNLSYQGNEFYIRVIRKLCKYKNTEFIEPHLGFFEQVFRLDGDTYYDGYWQSYKYFCNIEDLIRTSFEFSNIKSEKNLRCIKQISTSNSIGIHIRLGDYVNNPVYADICTVEYYKKAINHMRNNVINPVFYIFSNDISYCMNNLDILGGCYFIDWNTGYNSYLDMYLMSHCKHNIIANSSFSWWAAWLNTSEDKIVIAPSRWLNDTRININDILLPAWIKL